MSKDHEVSRCRVILNNVATLKIKLSGSIRVPSTAWSDLANKVNLIKVKKWRLITAWHNLGFVNYIVVSFEITRSCYLLKLSFWHLINYIHVIKSSVYYPDSKVHGANMGPTCDQSAPDRPHVGRMNLALRVHSTWANNITLQIHWSRADSFHGKSNHNLYIIRVTSMRLMMR